MWTQPIGGFISGTHAHQARHIHDRGAAGRRTPAPCHAPHLGRALPQRGGTRCMPIPRMPEQCHYTRKYAEAFPGPAPLGPRAYTGRGGSPPAAVREVRPTATMDSPEWGTSGKRQLPEGRREKTATKGDRNLEAVQQREIHGGGRHTGNGPGVSLPWPGVDQIGQRPAGGGETTAEGPSAMGTPGTCPPAGGHTTKRCVHLLQGDHPSGTALRIRDMGRVSIDASPL